MKMRHFKSKLNEIIQNIAKCCAPQNLTFSLEGHNVHNINFMTRSFIPMTSKHLDTQNQKLMVTTVANFLLHLP